MGVVIGTALGMVQLLLVTRANLRLGFSDVWFAVSDDVAGSFASQLSMMPLLVSAAAVCPKGDEGLLYAGLMSVSNFGGAVSTWGGAALTRLFGVTAHNFERLWMLCVVCSVLSLAPLFFVRAVPDDCDERGMPLSKMANAYNTNLNAHGPKGHVVDVVEMLHSGSEVEPL
jgi:hypothetical protein